MIKHGDRYRLKELLNPELEFVPEEGQGNCRGCFFEEAPVRMCPHTEGKLICSNYTAGPCGIWKEVK